MTIDGHFLGCGPGRHRWVRRFLVMVALHRRFPHLVKTASFSRPHEMRGRKLAFVPIESHIQLPRL